MSDESRQEFEEEDFLGGGGVREEEFGAVNVVREGEESYSVENDRETTSLSSLNKRIKEETSIDWLSALPDSLLIQILSLLEVKEAAITSVLSKRWRYLWTNLPRLEFQERRSLTEFLERSSQIEKTRKFVAWVNRTLVGRSIENYLEEFRVGFVYNECFSSDVDVWVEFAVKNKVKRVILLLDCDEDCYSLPEIMYSNSSLTHLGLQGCIVAPSTTIEWQSLTSLHIAEVELSDSEIQKILTGCPVLYNLHLEECWGFSRLEVNSQSLRVLSVSDYEYYEDEEVEPLLEISAPFVHRLFISLYPKGRKLRLTNIPSHVSAYIDFTEFGWDSSSMEVMSTTTELFEDIQHVKELELGRRCLEVLSMLVATGWQLPQSRRVCLTLNAFSEDNHDISGILGLLDSSPDLETLVIMGYEPSQLPISWHPPAKGDLDRDLMHLKTVKIKDFADPRLGGEPILTLARNLLKRATVLEQMVILIDLDISDFIQLGQTLLTFPRSSPKAVIQLL